MKGSKGMLGFYVSACVLVVMNAKELGRYESSGMHEDKAMLMFIYSASYPM
jgi:hypothetical protein